MIIYKITNLINNKIYIGQDSNNDNNYYGSGFLIKTSIKKYGKGNFKKEVLEYCKDKKSLDEREKYWIKEYNSTDKEIGYNISPGGTGGKLVDFDAKLGLTYGEYYGIEKSIEIKNKLKYSWKTRKFKLVNITQEDLNKKISESLLNLKMIRSDEQKKQISESLKSFFKTKEGLLSKENLSKMRKGKKLSDEIKMKISESSKGRIPKKLDVHPSSKYWIFYDHENNIILETLGDRTKRLKELNTNQRRIVIFDNLNECLSYVLPKNKDFKVFYRKYYL